MIAEQILAERNRKLEENRAERLRRQEENNRASARNAARMRERARDCLMGSGIKHLESILGRYIAPPRWRFTSDRSCVARVEDMEFLLTVDGALSPDPYCSAYVRRYGYDVDFDLVGNRRELGEWLEVAFAEGEEDK